MPDGERSMVEHQLHELNGYDTLVEVEGFEDENLAENIVKALNAQGHKIDGVFTHTENLQPVVGQICELLGIKQNPYSAYEKYDYHVLSLSCFYGKILLSNRRSLYLILSLWIFTV